MVDIFTGLEGSIGETELNFLREQRLRAIMATNRRNPNLSGSGFGARQGGSALGAAGGQILGRLFGDPAAKQATQVDAAIKAAEAAAPEEGTGPTADIDRRIEVAGNALANMKSFGLENSQSAKALRQNVQILRASRIERRKTLAETAKAETEADLAVESLRQEKGTGAGGDETTRLTNQLAALDPTNADDAKAADIFNARLDKLTEKRADATSRLSKDFDKVGFRKIAENISATTDTLDGFQDIERQFNPDFLTLGGQVKNFALTQLDKVFGLRGVSDDTKQDFAQFVQFRKDTLRSLNQYIQDVTGAQMSESEAKRIITALPSEQDGPEAFRAGLRDVILDLRATQARALGIADAQISGDKSAEIRARASSRNTFRQQILDEEAAALLGP